MKERKLITTRTVGVAFITGTKFVKIYDYFLPSGLELYTNDMVVVPAGNSFSIAKVVREVLDEESNANKFIVDVVKSDAIDHALSLEEDYIKKRLDEKLAIANEIQRYEDIYYRTKNEEDKKEIERLEILLERKNRKKRERSDI